MANSTVMNTYARLPVHFVRGEGAYLYDSDGKCYLDALSGIAVTNLGHAHPGVTAAIQEQAATLLHTSNVYGITPQEQLADALCRVTGMERVFFANSGAEANEAAIKLARLHGHNRGVESPVIVVMEQSFHGRTLATLTASGNRKIQAGFEPLVSGFIRAPYGNLEALRTIAQNNANVVAVLVEPVQGEGGVNTPPEGYFPALRALCDEQGWLMMLDEVQTGNGRTGDFFAFQGDGIVPDVVTTAKGLGNGVPIGACMARGVAAEVLLPGTHGSTFGGNFLACRAGLAVIEALEQGALENGREMGRLLLNRLRERLQTLPQVVQVRGRGMMIGIELNQPAGVLVQRALDKGLLINVTSERVIRLLPPLIFTPAQIEQLVDTLAELIPSLGA